MRKATKRVLVFLLCLAMSLNSMAANAWADDIDPGSDYSYETTDEGSNTDEVIDETITEESEDDADAEDADAEEADEDDAEAEDADSEDDASEDEAESEEDADTEDDAEAEDADSEETETDETEIEEIGNDAYYRALTADEYDVKASLADNYSSIRSSGEGTEYVANQMFTVVDTEEEALNIAEAYAEATGFVVELDSYRYGVAVYKISGETTIKGLTSLNSVQALAKVAADADNNLPAISPDYIRTIDSVGDSTFTVCENYYDPFLSWETDPEGYELYNPYYQWYHDKINDKYAWNLIDQNVYPYEQSKLSNITVAVLDTGIDWNHSDFSGSIIDHVNFVSASNEAGQTTDEANGMDTQGHGTNVAGIIGSVGNNAIGGRGVAAGVKLASVRVLSRSGGGSDSDITAGINWCVANQATYNIKVINMSLGGPSYDVYADEAIQAANDAGIIVIAAAGNESCDGDHYPACYNNVVSVAALNSDLKRADFSNYGATVDIAAPGGEGKVDAKAEGFFINEQLITTGSQYYGNSFVLSDGQYYCGMQGTSQATPVVSAVAALVFAYYSDPYGLPITPSYVEQRLKETATKITTDKPCGAGCVNVAAALGIADVAAIAKPVADYPNNAVVPLDGAVTLDCGDGSSFYSEALIFYTLDGKNPDIANYGKAGNNTMAYSGPISLSGTGKKTLKAVTYLYGKVSPVVTYTYTIDDKLVSRLSVVSATNQYDVGVGKKLTLKADIYPTTAKNKKVTWTSDDTTIATVTATGIVTGKSAGSTTIRVVSAENPAKFDTCTVTVYPAATQMVIANTCYVNGSPTKVDDIKTLNLYDSCVLDVRVYPEEASQLFTISSSNPAVASCFIDLSGNPVIEANKSGTAKITLTAADGSGISASITIKVVTPVTSIQISNKDNLSGVGAGKVLPLAAKFNYGLSVPEIKTITWSISAGSSYATIDQKGNLKANANIYSTKYIIVRATAANGVYGEKSISVHPLTTGFSYDYGTSLSGPVGAAGYLCDFITPYNQSEVYYDFAYSSSSPSVVAIDKDGFFRALKPGKATLSMKALDGSGKVGTVSLTIMPDSDNMSIKYNGTGPAVLYPGRKLTYSFVADAGFNYLKLVLATAWYPTDRGYARTPASTDGYITTAGNSVSGGAYLKYVTPGTVDTVKAVLKDGYYHYNSGLESKIELYPSGTSTVNFYTGSGIETVGRGYGLTLEKGDTFDLGRLVYSLPSDACQKYYTYASSNPKIVKVNADGTLIAVGGGKATVTVTAGDGSNKKSTITVTVNKAVEGITLSCPTIVNYGIGLYALSSGKAAQFKANVSNADATNKQIVWSVYSGSEYGTIDKNGKLTAKPGLTTSATIKIKAEAADGNGASDIASVKIYPAATAMTINETVGNTIVRSATLNIDQPGVTYDVVRTPATSSPYIEVESSNTNLVTASYNQETRKLTITPTGAGVGNVTVKATMLDGSNKVTSIAVKLVKPITSISVDAKGSYSYTSGGYSCADTYVGKYISLAATINADATTKKVTWSSSNTAAATVDANGKVKAIAPGIAQITATANDGLSGVVSRYFEVRVKETSIESLKLVTSLYGYDTDTATVSKTAKLANYLDSESSKYDGSEFKNYATYRIETVKKDTSKTGSTEYQITNSKPDVATVSLSSDSITVKANKPGSTVVTVLAADGSGKKATVTVTVFAPVKKVVITTSTGYDYVAQGAKITLTATTNEDAANKKVKWEIIQNSDYATITQTGVLTAKTGIGTGADKFVVVKATALDGTNITNDLGTPFKIKIVPATAPTWSPRVDSKDACTMRVGETKVITLQNGYGVDSYYQCTYTAGCGRVEYASRTKGTTKLNVNATKAGRITITAAATDGSDKKYVYTITVTN